MGKARERWRESLDRALPETPWLYGHLANGRVVPNRAAAANITPLAVLRYRPRLPFVERSAGVQKPCMRGMFLTYLVVIVGGCGACIVIGLTQR
jgi:hypothetical protein